MAIVGLKPFTIDPCNASLSEEVSELTTSVGSNPLRIFVHESVLSELPEEANIVIIINGNTYGGTFATRANDYVPLAWFLAQNGFIAVYARRPSSGSGLSPEEFVYQSIQAIINELEDI